MYDEQNDWYICRNNKLLKGKGEAVDDGRVYLVKKYYSLQSDCINCPLRNSCISDKAKTKKVQHSIYKAELERAKARQQTVKAKVMKRKRSSTGNVRVFAKAGNSLIVQPGTNAHLKICG